MRHWLLGTMALLALAGCGADRPLVASAKSPLLTQQVPSFHKKTVDGSEVATERLRGQPLVIDFFARHCRPCAESLPALEQLRQANPDIAIVGISEDDDLATAQRLRDDLKLMFPVVHDSGRVLAGRFRVSTLPATFVVDAQGRVRWHGDQGFDANELRAVVDSIRSD
jgi:peroxiredoxin